IEAERQLGHGGRLPHLDQQHSDDDDGTQPQLGADRARFECAGETGTACGDLHSAFLRNARSRALRARGFRATSSVEGVITLRFNSCQGLSGTPDPIWNGKWRKGAGGLKCRLILRSSPEWYARVTTTPPGRTTPGSQSNTAS